MCAFRVGLSGSFVRSDGKRTFPSTDFSPLTSDGVELVEMPEVAVMEPHHVEGFDAIVLLGERMEASSFPGDGRLKIICRMGVGYDTVDTKACTDNDVVLTITPDAVRRPMASTQLCFILALAHRLMEKDRVTRVGSLGWNSRLDYHGIGLTGRTVSSLGIGNIGAEMFRLLKPHDVRMIAHDPYISEAGRKIAEEIGVELVDLDAVFSEGDFVTFNCPLTEETRGIGSAANIAKMKREAYLINISRGPVVDQKALYDALVEGRIAGAGLDVFEPEPPAADEPILKLSNVLMGPHALGWTDEMFRVMGEVNVAAIRAYRAGEEPANIVNRDVLDRPGFKEKLAGRA